MRDEFEAELIACRAYMARQAVKLCRDASQAEDLVSETTLRALRYRDNFTIGTNMRGWLSFIMRNLFLTQKRRGKWDGGSTDTMLPSQLPQIAAPQGLSIDLADTLRALETLPKDQRDAILLVGAGATYEEAADEMCVSVGTVKSRVARGRDALAEALA